jgi:hypothetical protein
MEGIYYPALVADCQIIEMDAGFSVPPDRITHKLTFSAAVAVQLAVNLRRYPQISVKFVSRTR